MELDSNKRIIRVANIIEEGKLGGPQIRIVMVAEAMKGQVDTTVIMPNENSEAFRQRCDEAGIRYKTLPISRITKEWRVALRYVLFSFFEVFQIVSFLRKEKFDIIHVSGGSWQYKGVVAGKLAGIKVIWHLNDTSMPVLFRELFGAISGLSDGYIYSANRSKEYYKAYARKNKMDFVVLPPVDTVYFDPDVNYECRSVDNDWDEKIIVGSVANINPVKGFDVLIRSASRVLHSYDNVKFIVVGPVFKNQEKYYRYLQDMLCGLGIDVFEFVGGVDDIRGILSHIDIYVCSSVSETGPMTLFEAMSMEKPIVSTDVGDVSTYVKDGVNGYIVDVGDSVALADRIGLLIDDPGLREKFGKKNRNIALNELDINKCSDRHIQAYSKLINFHV